MLMKVHPKGQVVIPAEIRRRLGIDIGDMLDVVVVPDEGKIELRRSAGTSARAIAGALRAYARGKPFPSEEEVAEALRSGLGEDG